MATLFFQHHAHACESITLFIFSYPFLSLLLFFFQKNFILFRKRKHMKAWRIYFYGCMEMEWNGIMLAPSTGV